MDYAKIIRERRPKLRDNSVIAYALSLKSIEGGYNTLSRPLYIEVLTSPAPMLTNLTPAFASPPTRIRY